MASEFDIRMSDALEAGNHGEITTAMKDAKANLQDKDYQYFLAKTVMLLFPCTDVQLLRAVAEQDAGALKWVTPWHLTQELSPDVLKAVVDLGWDINTRDDDGGTGSRPSLLQQVCYDDDLVQWCLNHGASVEDDPSLDPHISSPLLESAAGQSTVATFKLLHSHGAQLGERTLHQAVSAAAARRKTPQDHKTRMEMVKYLVEGLKLDVNALDTKEVRHRHPGPPLCYAISGQDSKDVVRYLLEHGADPTIKDCWGEQDAISLAEKADKTELVKLLKEHTTQ